MISSGTSFSEINGINIENLHNGDLLIYNEDNNTWSAKSPIQVIPIMTGATEQADGTSGLVPVPKAGSNNLFLKGNGSWADPVPQVLKKQVADLIALDNEKSAREIAAEESAKIKNALNPVINNLNNRIELIESSNNTYITNQIFVKGIGDLTQLFNAQEANNTVVDAINNLDTRLTWQKII